jgi:hypothetical protein
MTPHENLRAALQEIKISLELLSVVTAEDLAVMPDEGGWHVASDALAAAERLQEAEDAVRESKS